MRLTRHFTPDEFERTTVDLPNRITAVALPRILCLCAAILEPWRERVGALRVTSGFRTWSVNEELRRRGRSASRTSQHLRGEAADLQPVSGELAAAWHVLVELVRAGLPVDQAIVYQRGGEGWVHVSHTNDRAPRRELLVQPDRDHSEYVPWSQWSGPLVLP